MNLESLGATAAVSAAFESLRAQGLLPGRVAQAQCEQYILATGTEELEAEVSGAFRFHSGESMGLPVVGDWVAARPAGAGRGIIEAVLPRRTCFARRAPGKRELRQAIAANIDVAFLVCGLDHDFNLRRLERYLALTAESGAAAVVVLNKADLCPDLERRLSETSRVACGWPVVAASTLTGPDGMRDLREFVSGNQTMVLLGSSGVGKSSIANALLGEKRLETSEVRPWDGRGRHTTTRRELLALPGGGALIDTPGMREIQLWASEETVEEVFEEILELAAQCRFRDCSHHGEPGCAVAEALRSGELDGTRWESYRKLAGEARRHETALQRKRAERMGSRELKRIYKRREKP